MLVCINCQLLRYKDGCAVGVIKLLFCTCPAARILEHWGELVRVLKLYVALYSRHELNNSANRTALEPSKNLSRLS